MAGDVMAKTIEIRDTLTCEPFDRGMRQAIAFIKAVREFSRDADWWIKMMKINENSLNDPQNQPKVRTKGYIGETPKRFKKRPFESKKGTSGEK